MKFKYNVHSSINFVVNKVSEPICELSLGRRAYYILLNSNNYL